MPQVRQFAIALEDVNPLDYVGREADPPNDKGGEVADADQLPRADPAYEQLADEASAPDEDMAFSDEGEAVP